MIWLLCIENIFFRTGNKTFLFDDVKTLPPQLYPLLPLCITTGKNREGLNHSLEDTLTHSLFTTTRTVDECPSKPSPKIIFSICDELGLDTKDVLMIGDTTYDLHTVSNAESHTIALTTGAHTIEKLHSAPSIKILPSFHSFFDWFMEK